MAARRDSIRSSRFTACDDQPLHTSAFAQNGLPRRVRFRSIADVPAAAHDRVMWTSLKLIALIATAIWASLFFVMLALTSGTLGGSDGRDLVAVLVPLAAASVTGWVGLFGPRIPTWLAITIELSLLGAGAFSWLIVAAASGG